MFDLLKWQRSARIYTANLDMPFSKDHLPDLYITPPWLIWTCQQKTSGFNMGIKDLWPILEPYCERKPLFELEGKIVAIDLAGWVCESMCVVDYAVQPRFYLRNLFFRTCYLLLSGVTPVYVLEGSAPALKYGVICKRNDIQFRGARPKKLTQLSQASQTGEAPKKKAAKGRSAFNHVQKQCEELIASMGLQCVQGPGEAEAFCSYMNQDAMVDGVISQDSDCFAYGAVRVYRNFSVSTQGKSAAQGGAVDVYDIRRVEQAMDFGRNKVIVMALLSGCDYCPDGVGGVGRDAVVKLFNMYKDNEILNRIKEWRLISHKYTALELKVDDKSVCVNCGHLGRVQNHTKNGCTECREHRGCDANRWKDQRLAIKSELSIRTKALSNSEFPSQAIIDEFLIRPVTLPKLDLKWKQPNVIKFLNFMTKLLQWDELYCFQKFLPLLTRWQLFHFGNSNDGASRKVIGSVQPDYIKKKRAPKGVASYEIIWKDENKCFEGLIPDEQLKSFLDVNPNGLQLLWSTIEPMDLVERAYPKLVNDYQQLLAKPKKAARKKRERKEIVNPDSELQTNKANKPSQKKPTATKPTNPLIKRFLQKNQINGIPPTSPKIKTCSTPVAVSPVGIDLDTSAWNDDDTASDSVINGIVTKSPEIVEILGRRLRFERFDMRQKFETSFEEFVTAAKQQPGKDFADTPLECLNSNVGNASTPISAEKHRPRVSLVDPVESDANVSVSHFFGGGNAGDVDAFEASIDFHNMPDEFPCDSDNEEDVADVIKDDGKLPGPSGLCKKRPHAISRIMSNTFDLENYVPIGEKLRQKLNSN